MGVESAYRQAISDYLFDAVKKYVRGGGIGIVKGDSGEFTVERLGISPAAFTVQLLPYEPSFQAHFARPRLTLSNVSFTVSEREYDYLDVKTSRWFPSVDEAAAWLLSSLTQD
jgi:hypothetical protein